MKFGKKVSGGLVSPKGKKSKAGKNATKFANYVSPRGKGKR